MALAGRVIASHYAEPLLRHVARDTGLLAAPSLDAQSIADLRAGDAIRLLDDCQGWAWGYGPDGRVGYIPSEAVEA